MQRESWLLERLGRLTRLLRPPFVPLHSLVLSPSPVARSFAPGSRLFYIQSSSHHASAMKTVWRWGQKVALDRRIRFNVTGQTYSTFFSVLICPVVSWAQITMDLSFMAAQVRWIYTQRYYEAFAVVSDNFYEHKCAGYKSNSWLRRCILFKVIVWPPKYNLPIRLVSLRTWSWV